MTYTLWELWDEPEKPRDTHACTGNSCKYCATMAIKPSIESAMEASLSLASDWRYKANAWFTALSKGATFTSEDLTAGVGLPSGSEGMNRNNAVGAYLQSLSRSNRIVKVDITNSKAPRSHGATIIVWKKC